MNESTPPEIATEKTVLNIPYDDRNRAIRAAGKLSNGENALLLEDKVWYAKPGANLSKLEEWRVDPNKVEAERPLDVAGVKDEFAAWLEAQGAILTEPPILDGKKHYVDVEDAKKGSLKGAYAGYLDGRPAGWFRNFKTDSEPRKWVSDGVAPDPEQIALQRAQSALQRQQREKDQRIAFDKVAARLEAEYRSLPAANGSEAYHVNKMVKPSAGVKTDNHGNVVIPLYNSDGEFRTLERIWPDGSKHLDKGGQAWGSYHVVGGQLHDGQPILYAEGYATANSISEATRHPVVMTVNAGNMVEVAKALKENYPNSPHYFLADNDIYKTENVGLAKATEAAALTDGFVALPKFSSPHEGLTDFNDLHAADGLAAVKQQVEAVITQHSEVKHMNDVKPQSEVLPANSQNAAETTIVAPALDAAPAVADVSPEPAVSQPSTDAANVPETTIVAPALNAAPAVADVSPEPAVSYPGTDAANAPETTTVAPALDAAPVAADVSPVAAESQPGASSATEHNEDDEQADSQDMMAAYLAMQGQNEAPELKRTAAIKPVEDDEQAPADKKRIAEPTSEEHNNKNGFTWANDDNASTPPKERLDLDVLMQQISYRSEKDYVAYLLDGKDAFYDYGSHLRMASPEASSDDAMILSALQTSMAQHKRGIEITGSEEFKERVFNLMADYKIEAKLTDPQQRARFQEVKKTFISDVNAKSKTEPKEKKDPSEAVNAGKEQTATKESPLQSENGISGSTPTSGGEKPEEDKEKSGWVNGVIQAHGRAPYEFKEGESMSYYVTLKNERDEKTIWGKDLERAVKNAGVDTGRLINAKRMGAVDVEVKAPVRDENDKIVRYETISAKRNEWSVKPVYPQASQDNPAALQPSHLVAYDAVTFKKMRDKVEQALGVSLQHEPQPKNEVFWFQPDGKPAAADMQKPADVKLPEDSAHEGRPLMVSPSAKNELPEYFLLESKKGFFQGAVRDKETDLYHSVIGKINTKEHNGQLRTYITLAAVNANAENGMVLHGYGNANENGNGIVYKNLLNKEMKPQHLQPVSDDVKNKSVMKGILHQNNSAKRDDDERRTQTHAPSAKNAPRP
ncbi:TPA: LPD7 domain-containing protein [Yersinia enterocolitica]